MHLLENLRKNSLAVAIVLVYIMADMVLTCKEIYILNLVPVVLFIDLSCPRPY